MVDLTILFENWQLAFVKVCKQNLAKYKLLVDTLRRWGYEVMVKVLIIRVFRAWEPSNKSILHACRVSLYCAKWMRRLMASDTV